MAKKQIIVDDLTDAEIDQDAVRFTAKISLALIASNAEDQPEEFTAEWDLAQLTADAFRTLVDGSDLATFITRLRPLVKINAPDSDVVRKWIQTNHPELKLKDRGRIPADMMALYRRESQAKSQAEDRPTGPDAATVLTQVANS